jgi:hypothetical protein
MNAVFAMAILDIFSIYTYIDIGIDIGRDRDKDVQVPVA